MGARRNVGHGGSKSKDRTGGRVDRTDRQRQGRSKREGGSSGSSRGMDGALQEALGEIISSSGEARAKGCSGKGRGCSRTGKAARTSMIARSGSRIEGAIGRQAKVRGSTGDWEIEVEGTAVHTIRAERNDRVKIAEHGKAKNSIDGDIRAQSKGNGDGDA